MNTQLPKCTIRGDLLDDNLRVPVGDSYYGDPNPLHYRYLHDDDDGFQVLYQGKWQVAYTVDFDFIN